MWVIEITVDSAKKQNVLYVETKTFQHINVKVVFNVNSRFSINLDGSGVCDDNGGGKGSVFTGVRHGE